MNTNTLTEDGADALFLNPPEAQAAYVLWYRPSRRHRWEPVHSAATEYECVIQMSTGCGGTRHNGMWLILPSGREP